LQRGPTNINDGFKYCYSYYGWYFEYYFEYFYL